MSTLSHCGSSPMAAKVGARVILTSPVKSGVDHGHAGRSSAVEQCCGGQIDPPPAAHLIHRGDGFRDRGLDGSAAGAVVAACGVEEASVVGQPEGTILCCRNFKPRLCLLGRHGALLHPTIRSNDNGPCCCDRCERVTGTVLLQQPGDTVSVCGLFPCCRRRQRSCSRLVRAGTLSA